VATVEVPQVVQADLAEAVGLVVVTRAVLPRTVPPSEVSVVEVAVARIPRAVMEKEATAMVTTFLTSGTAFVRRPLPMTISTTPSQSWNCSPT
jgi:hypothetical protein